MIYRYKTINHEVIPIHKIIAHKFSIEEDRDDKTDRLKTWMLSEEGQFFNKHADSLKIDYFHRVDMFLIDVIVIAEIEESKLSEYYLKFAKEY